MREVPKIGQTKLAQIRRIAEEDARNVERRLEKARRDYARIPMTKSIERHACEMQIRAFLRAYNLIIGDGH